LQIAEQSLLILVEVILPDPAIAQQGFSSQLRFRVILVQALIQLLRHIDLTQTLMLGRRSKQPLRRRHFLLSINRDRRYGQQQHQQ